MRPRRPMPTILKAESLDTGREIKDNFVDDFTGEVVVPEPDLSPVRELPMPQDLRNQDNLAVIAAKRAILIKLGIIKCGPTKTS